MNNIIAIEPYIDIRKNSELGMGIGYLPIPKFFRVSMYELNHRIMMEALQYFLKKKRKESFYTIQDELINKKFQFKIN
jgi:hypothetical protein